MQTNGEVINVKEYSESAFQIAVDHGFWEDERSLALAMGLVKSEIGEAIGAAQKNRYVSDFEKNSKVVEDYDAASDLGGFISAWFNLFKGCVEEELADVVIRLLDTIKGFDADVERKRPAVPAWDYESFKKLNPNPHFCEVANQAFLITNPSTLLFFVLDWATDLGINIKWFVDHKMKYNKTRPYKHGKKF